MCHDIQLLLQWRRGQSHGSSSVTCPVATCCKATARNGKEHVAGTSSQPRWLLRRRYQNITRQKAPRAAKVPGTRSAEVQKGQRLDTVTLFSETGRNSSLAVSRNSTIGLSCVTHWIRSSLCSSNRTDKVFPSPALPGGERIRDTQEKLVNLKKMTAWSVERDLTE